MVVMLKTVLGALLLLFQSRSQFQVEVLALRQQLIVLRCTAPKRVRPKGAGSAAVRAALSSLAPSVLDSITVFQLDTIVRWHQRLSSFGDLDLSFARM
jgi:hypothetical protein